MMIDPMKILFNSLTVWKVSGFDQVQRTMMASLISQAASGDSLRKFAAGNMSAPDNETMYALVQCTPDLDELDCTKCLRQAAGAFASCCSRKWGGRVLTPSCTLRYETYSFCNPTADTLVVPAPPPPSTPPVLYPPLPARDMAT
ncbi:cysteine-rich receptor-like protein kinase 26 [Quercus suber]|uniref:Cysteine-rich receptor-like protein kinase 26 n=1 Tax=Quercus suber TaxID=58331 RepID=A0AAW0IYU9_QUESU